LSFVRALSAHIAETSRRDRFRADPSSRYLPPVLRASAVRHRDVDFGLIAFFGADGFSAGLFLFAHEAALGALSMRHPDPTVCKTGENRIARLDLA